MARSTFQITPAQREFLRQLAYVSDRPMRAVLDDALLLLDDVTSHQSPTVTLLSEIHNRYQKETNDNGR